MSSTLPSFKLTPAQDKARDVLISEATHVALGGGSRSGKTFLIIRQIIIRAILEPGSRHGVFRFRFNSIKASIVYDTLPKVLSLCFPELPPLSTLLNKTDWFMRLPNGSEIWFIGLDSAERVEKVLGMEFASLYFNESSQIAHGSMTMALTRLAQKTKVIKLKTFTDFNPPSRRHWTYRRFISKTDPFSKKAVPDPLNYGFYLINPMDNVENLGPEYISILEALPTRERNRFLLGKFSDDSDGALWTEELLHQQRVMGQEGSLPDWLRIIISVDPSGCSGEETSRSDEIGIIVLALGTDSNVYILEDLSGKYSPEGWGQVVASAFDRHNADRVVGESNFGGDMVRAIVHASNPDIPFTLVHASRGKVVRAEPVAALYEMLKVFHVGHFPELEDQMCSMNQGGYVGLKSPDRLDALVWGVSELFPRVTKRKVDDNWRPPKAVTVSRSASRFDRGGGRR